jgi:hypothetical protein
MLDVRPHDDAPSFAPFAADGANGRGSIERQEDLDGMVRVRRHFAAGLPDRQEAAFP